MQNAHRDARRKDAEYEQAEEPSSGRSSGDISDEEEKDATRRSRYSRQ